MAAPAILVPLLALLGIGLAASKDDEAKTGPPPPLDKQTLDAFTEIRMVDGTPVRYFKSAAAGPIIQALSKSGVVPAQLLGSTGVYGILKAAQDKGAAMALEVVAARDDLANAGQVVALAQQQGSAVLGTLNLVTLSGPGRAVIVAKPAVRAMLAHPDLNGPFAVLLDPGDKRPVPSPPGPYGAPPAPGGPTPMPDIQPVPTGIPAPPPGDGLDATMPTSTRQAVTALLADPTVSPDALDQAAADFAPKYPLAAEKLRARAAELREGERLAHIQRGSTPFVVRQGDLPSMVAAHYTQDGGRWKEIQKDGQKLTQANLPKKWIGTVDLPLSWQAWGKPLPPVASGKAKKGKSAAEQLGAKEIAEIQKLKGGASA